MAIFKLAAAGAVLFGVKKGLDMSGVKVQDMYIKKEIKKLFENRGAEYEALLKKVESKSLPLLSDEYESKKKNLFLAIMDVNLTTKLHFSANNTFKLKTTVWFKGLQTEFKIKGSYVAKGQRFTLLIDQENDYKLLPEEYQKTFDVIVKEDKQSEETNDVAIYFNMLQKSEKTPILFTDSW